MSGFEQLFPGQLPRLVMFDLDGTLIDSVPDLAAAVDTMLLSLGRKPAGIEAVREWVGNGAPVLVRRALAGGIDHSAVDDVEAEHARLAAAGLSPRNLVDFKNDGVQVAKFFFIADPDGYQIEVLQRGGRFQ